MIVKLRIEYSKISVGLLAFLEPFHRVFCGASRRLWLPRFEADVHIIHRLGDIVGYPFMKLIEKKRLRVMRMVWWLCTVEHFFWILIHQPPHWKLWLTQYLANDEKLEKVEFLLDVRQSQSKVWQLAFPSRIKISRHTCHLIIDYRCCLLCFYLAGLVVASRNDHIILVLSLRTVYLNGWADQLPLPAQPLLAVGFQCHFLNFVDVIQYCLLIVGQMILLPYAVGSFPDQILRRHQRRYLRLKPGCLRLRLHLRLRQRLHLHSRELLAAVLTAVFLSKAVHLMIIEFKLRGLNRIMNWH